MTTALVVRTMSRAWLVIKDVTTGTAVDIIFTFGLAALMSRSHWRISPRSTFDGFISRSEVY